MKQKLIFLLALLLCFGCLSGCSGKEASDPEIAATPATNPPAESTAPTEAEDEPEHAAEESDSAAEAAARMAKYQHAYEKFSPDDVVMTVNGKAVLWSELFSWLYDAMTQLENAYNVEDWSAEFPELADYMDHPSYGLYANNYAVTNAIQIAVILTKAEELGIDLSETQQEELENTIESYYTYFGSEEDFKEKLATSFLTEDYFRAQNKVILLYNNLYENMFGENGKDFPEEDAVNYAKSNGYLYAKHILFSTVDDERKPLSEKEIAEKKALAENVLAQLKTCPAEELEQQFDKLAQEYSEDPGLQSNPNGYYFTAGQMVTAFEDAVLALNDNELSELVESEYGYHIIFCPPMEADDEIGYNSQYEPFTAREMASVAVFNNCVQEWYYYSDVVPAEEFMDLDINALMSE